MSTSMSYLDDLLRKLSDVNLERAVTELRTLRTSGPLHKVRKGCLFLGRCDDVDLWYRVRDGVPQIDWAGASGLDASQTWSDITEQDHPARQEAWKRVRELGLPTDAATPKPRNDPRLPRFGTPDDKAIFLGRNGQYDLWYRIENGVPQVDYFYHPDQQGQWSRADVVSLAPDKLAVEAARQRNLPIEPLNPKPVDTPKSKIAAKLDRVLEILESVEES